MLIVLVLLRSAVVLLQAIRACAIAAVHPQNKASVEVLAQGETRPSPSHLAEISGRFLPSLPDQDIALSSQVIVEAQHGSTTRTDLGAAEASMGLSTAFFLGESGANACPNGAYSVSEVSCLRAAKSLLPEGLNRTSLALGDGTGRLAEAWGSIPPGCSIRDGSAYYNLGAGDNSGGYVPVCTRHPWEAVLAVTAHGMVLINVGEEAFNWLFSRCPVVQFMRDGALHSVYRRHTRTCNMESAYKLFALTWDKTENAFNTDFSIYNNVEDARKDQHRWGYCDFGEAGVGYPNNCGSHGKIGDTWFALPGEGKWPPPNLSVGASFEIYTGSDCPSPVSQPPLCEWERAVELKGTGKEIGKDVGPTAFNTLFAKCPVVEYKRNGELHSIYRRLTPVPSAFDAYKLFTGDWENASNVLNVDFELFTDMRKTRWGWDPWRSCSYGKQGIGYPGDCGPVGHWLNRWFTLPTSPMRAPALTDGASLSVYKRKDCPSAVSSSGSRGRNRRWKVAMTVSSDGQKLLLDIGAATFNRLFQRCPVVRYVRNRKVHSIYSRITRPSLVDNPYKLFFLEWRSEHNVLNRDFGIYSSLEDAHSRKRSWSFCSYDAGWGVGYPHLCGAEGPTQGEWFVMPFEGSGKLQTNITTGALFHIYVGSDCPSQAAAAS